MTFDFSSVPDHADILLEGLLWTVLITCLAGLISVLLGIAMAVAALYGPTLVGLPLRAVVFLFMATPLLLQLYLLYYGLSQIGIRLPAFWTGVVGIGIHYAAYNSDILQAALKGVDPGQGEAARSLGFAKASTLLHFVVPQAMLSSLPQMGNNAIMLLKDTAVLSVLGIAELVLNTQRAISETYRPFEFYLIAAALYYAVNLLTELALRAASRRAEVVR